MHASELLFQYIARPKMLALFSKSWRLQSSSLSWSLIVKYSVSHLAMASFVQEHEVILLRSPTVDGNVAMRLNHHAPARMTTYAHQTGADLDDFR